MCGRFRRSPEQSTAHILKLTDLFFQKLSRHPEIRRTAVYAEKAVRRTVKELPMQTDLIRRQNPSALFTAFYLIYEPALLSEPCSRPPAHCSGSRRGKSPALPL